MKKIKKSDLSKQAETFFSFQNSHLPVVYTPTEFSPSYLVPPTIVRTFATYSVGEAPIPDLTSKKHPNA
jgi:hypothetical protein